jgi:hypothetical protein
VTATGSVPATVAGKLAELGLTRVVHFTPAKNLHHIVADGQMRPTTELAELAPEYFAPTDTLRLDDHPDLTCVTFTHPNPFYFDTARGKEEFKRFPDWVCLLIGANVLTRDGTLFSPCNAAKGRGAYLMPGVEGLARCFASPTILNYQRSPSHHPSCATDLQAEALVPGPIPLSDVTAIVTPTVAAARNGYARLNAADLEPGRISWVVSPKMFTPWPLVNAIQQGLLIDETAWLPGQED